MTINFEELIEQSYPYIIQYGTNLVLAIFVLIIGLRLSGFLANQVEKLLDKREIDVSLKIFLKNITRGLLRVLVFILTLSTLGLEMTSLVALLGAAGLAVGMALSGTLQNFAGGIVILVLKPFKVGDFITAQGHSGTVKGIQIFHTHLTTPDNKVIVIPNGPLSSGSLVNVNANDTRRVDFVFGIGYGDDIQKAKTLINEVFVADNRILKDPAHFIAVTELADSSVNIVARAWVKTPDYWAVFHNCTEQVKVTFDKNNISIPFPQTDVHLHKVN